MGLDEEKRGSKIQMKGYNLNGPKKKMVFTNREKHNMRGYNSGIRVMTEVSIWGENEIKT